MRWEELQPARDRPPDEIVADREEGRTGDTLPLEGQEVALLNRVVGQMRRDKPHYHVVFREFLRRGDFKISCSDQLEEQYIVDRGFYSDLSQRLGITPNAVKKRLRASLRWFLSRARIHQARGDRHAR